jgi:RNA 3'-terminal phosphate cyclase (ATP)
MVEAQLQPCAQLQGLRLRERGSVKLSGFSAVAGLSKDIARRQARRASVRLEREGLRAVIREEQWEGGPGTVLAVIVETEPVPALFFGLGARGKPAERVADEAVDLALAYLRAAPAVVDAHSADQLVLPLALADGPSEYTVAEVTEHLLTNVAIIRRFVERDILCEGEVGKPGLVQIA